jgi:hypothetical protein
MDFTKHTFGFSLLSEKGDIEELKIENVEDRDEAYQQMRLVFCDENNLTITEFEKRYDIKSEKHKVSFKNPPWKDGEELKSDLMSIEGISYVTYIPPLKGAYGPPKFFTRTAEDYESIQESVNDYYGGLEVREDRDSIFIIVSPTATTSDK